MFFPQDSHTAWQTTPPLKPRSNTIPIHYPAFYDPHLTPIQQSCPSGCTRMTPTPASSKPHTLQSRDHSEFLDPQVVVQDLGQKASELNCTSQVPPGKVSR